MGPSSSLDAAYGYVDAFVGAYDLAGRLGSAYGEGPEGGGGEGGLLDEVSAALAHESRSPLRRLGVC